MSAARKTKAPVSQPSLRERANAARASATRLTRRGAQADPGSDPILKAIECHAAAAQAFRASLNPTDAVWAKQQGRDASSEATAKAEAAWEAADLAQIEAWNALFDTQPTTAAGLVLLLRHVSEHAENMLDTGGTYTAASIFGVLADRVTALTGQLTGPSRCHASSVATHLGKAAAEWFEADAQDDLNSSALNAIDRRIDTLAEALSYTRAFAPAGMLGQLAVAFAGLDMALNGRENLRERYTKRAERCLLSVAAGLCAVSGIDREGYGASYFMSGEFDWMACLVPEAVR